jgi:hypothetical protein
MLNFSSTIYLFLIPNSIYKVIFIKARYSAYKL